MTKPIVLHLGDDIRWNHDQYSKFQDAFDVRRSYSMSRPEFIRALKERQFGDFFAIYRPFWNTGGEMGNWDEELVSLLPSSCKIYASAGAGFDWVDTAALAKRGVIYCNAAAACTESVADAAIWLIISTFRLFSWSHIAARTLDADAFVDANRNLAMVSHNPNGHTLGIIGFGQIGRRTAEKAFLAMNMKIHYHDIVQMPAHLEAVSKATYHKSMDSLLAVSDCVMVATPFSGETLLNASLLAKMKTGSRLINIARGKLLDESALVDALRSGKLAAAGLDVHYDEPNPQASSSTTAGPTAKMSAAQPMDITTARHLLEQAIINLRNFIDLREMVVSVGNVDPETFEELSSHIWDTKLEIARQIREFSDPRGATMLTNFFHRLIGNMPNADGVVP
ncbi:hypothetical protein PENCOP_c011G03219 [Penicillium coprophilum]|uniref:D-isomer specific 2-hydroxyacid dehydrogenase NAD-binding domain-containing protein n=1 Tax=Penicillium coprophilum TaxID=36646 RepID=A0A1V6UEI8_9EURO|nr:hypothetical protein PENCOP_c011G03219 [Penicillium coprophilum]